MASLLSVQLDPASGLPYINISPSKASSASPASRPSSTLFTGPPQGNSRRQRFAYSPAATSLLETEFSDNPYPDHSKREELAHKLGVTESRIHTWFTNKRARTKKKINNSPAAPSSGWAAARKAAASRRRSATPPDTPPAAKRSRLDLVGLPAGPASPIAPAATISPHLPSFSTLPGLPDLSSQPPTMLNPFLPSHFFPSYFSFPQLPYGSLMPSPLLPGATSAWPTMAPVSALRNPGRTSPHPIGFLHSSPKQPSQSPREASPKQGEADSGYCEEEGELDVTE